MKFYYHDGNRRVYLEDVSVFEVGVEMEDGRRLSLGFADKGRVCLSAGTDRLVVFPEASNCAVVEAK